MTDSGLRHDFPLLWEKARQFDFEARLGGCTDPLLTEISQVLHELWLGRSECNWASGPRPLNNGLNVVRGALLKWGATHDDYKDASDALYATEEELVALRDSLGEMVAVVRYRAPREAWLDWRHEAIKRAKALLTEADIERGEKMWAHPGDFKDLQA